MIQAFDSRVPVLVAPSEIRPGDWLRDLGTLRQVAAVEELPSATGTGQIYEMHFASIPGTENLMLGIPSTVNVTIWRRA